LCEVAYLNMICHCAEVHIFTCDVQPDTHTHFRNVHTYACSLEDIQLTKGRWGNERTCEETEGVRGKTEGTLTDAIEIISFCCASPKIVHVLSVRLGNSVEDIKEKLYVNIWRCPSS